MIFTLISILFIFLELSLVTIFIYLSYKNNSFISKSTTWYIIPTAFIAVCIIGLGYIYESNNTFSFDGLGICVEYAAGLFVYTIKVTHITTLLNDNLTYACCYYGIVALAIFTSTTSILGICKNTTINFIRVSLFKIRGADIVVGYGAKALEYAKNTKNCILWIEKPIKMNKDFILKELYYSKIPYVMFSLNKRTIKSFIWRRKKEYNFVFFKENNSLEYNQLSILFKSVKFKQNRNIKVYLEGDKDEISFINDQIAASEHDTQCLMFCFDVYEKMARRFNWEYTIAECLPKGFINIDGTINEEKIINVVFLGYGKVNSALFKSLVMNNQFASYNKDHYEVKLVNYYLYDSKEDNFNDFTMNRLEQNYFCKNNREPFSKMEKLCNLSHSTKNIMSKDAQKEIQEYIEKPNSFTLFYVGFSEDLVNISYAERLLHDYGRDKIRVFCNLDNSSNTYKIDQKTIGIYGLKNQIFSHEWIINDKILELAIRRDYGYQLKSKNYANLKKWGSLSYIKKYSNVYSVLSLKFKLNLMGLDIAKDKDKKISEEEFNKIYYASDSPSSNGYKQYFDHNLRCTIGFTEHLRWCAFYYLNGYDVMDHTLCHLVENNIITKNEKEKFHADLLSYYGLDDLTKYLLEKYPEKNLMDIEVYQYDYLLCDLLMKDIAQLKKALFDLEIKRLNND